jgi:hypothetical protein
MRQQQSRRGRRKGSPYKLPGTAAWKGSRGPIILKKKFVFLGKIIICRLYNLTLSDQAHVTLRLQSVQDTLRFIFARQCKSRVNIFSPSVRPCRKTDTDGGRRYTSK